MQVEQELDRFQDDMAYFDRHREEILKQYPEKWVAIHKHEVVGAAKALPASWRSSSARVFGGKPSWTTSACARTCSSYDSRGLAA